MASRHTKINIIKEIAGHASFFEFKTFLPCELLLCFCYKWNSMFVSWPNAPSADDNTGMCILSQCIQHVGGSSSLASLQSMWPSQTRSPVRQSPSQNTWPGLHWVTPGDGGHIHCYTRSLACHKLASSWTTYIYDPQRRIVGTLIYSTCTYTEAHWYQGWLINIIWRPLHNYLAVT